MMLVEETPVSDAVLPVAQLKEYLRLATGFADDADQDGLLSRHLRAAMATIEARIGKILLERDFSWTLRAWRDPRRQLLPAAPVAAITHVTQVAQDGRETPTDPAAWALVADGPHPALVARAGLLPAVPPHGAVRIGLLAGFGPEWSDLPADLAQASLMLAAHHYDARHDLGGAHGRVPAGVTALIDPYRVLRLGGRA
ncbi:head-tail connector protein [Yoonia vestfoldensis]|uniref:Phage gp6-like head-tail connector protein n=1 Tax=Yoonia vestfoldensis TaxID=245188 RepID=A0A1Y0ECF7_9RHOB|nr:hypothetical protein [Yoonia vestfoldensis]ARU01022.1 phage gp6-like head-tail connector protein [Yoonia vestfoldensis]